MNEQLVVLEQREKKYYDLYKKYQLNITLMREKGIDDQTLKNTTLELVDIAIKLNDIREEIYQIKTTSLMKIKAKSSHEEKERISELVELASIRKNEIEELFGANKLAETELEKQTNEFILYSEKLKTINSYLEIKEKEEILVAENNQLIDRQAILQDKMLSYDQENDKLVTTLKENAKKAMHIMNVSSENESTIISDSVTQLRLKKTNEQLLLYYQEIESEELPSDYQKVIKEVKKNQKQDALEYLKAREKHIVLLIAELADNINSNDFSKLYDNLLSIQNLLEERTSLRRENKIEEKDQLAFLSELVSKQIKQCELQIAARTSLDSSEKKIEENKKNIEFYRTLISNSNDIKQVLGEYIEEEVTYDEEIPENEEEKILVQEDTPSVIELPAVMPTPEEENLEAPKEEKTEEVPSEMPISEKESPEELIPSPQEEEPNEEVPIPEMEDVNPYTIINVDDASQELKANVQASYHKFGNWFKKQWDRFQNILFKEPAEEEVKRKIK